MTLKEYITQYNITVVDLAKHLDYTRAHISNIIHGKCKPSSKLKRQILHFTGGQVKM